MDDFSKAWRHGQRAVWKLPYNTHRRYLPLLCNSIPVEDEICRRFLSFLRTCLASDCGVVKFVVKHSLLYGGMFSLSGRNALFCSNRFNFDVSNILKSDFNPNNIVRDWCVHATSDEDLDAISMIMELTFIRDGVFYSPDLSRTDVTNFISSICTM